MFLHRDACYVYPFTLRKTLEVKNFSLTWSPSFRVRDGCTCLEIMRVVPSLKHKKFCALRGVIPRAGGQQVPLAAKVFIISCKV